MKELFNGNRYSDIYKRKGKLFRYDYLYNLVSFIYIAEEDDELLNQRKGEIIELDSAGLKKENWNDISKRNMYLDEFIFEIDEEVKYLLNDNYKYIEE